MGSSISVRTFPTFSVIQSQTSVNVSSKFKGRSESCFENVTFRIEIRVYPFSSDYYSILVGCQLGVVGVLPVKEGSLKRIS